MSSGSTLLQNAVRSRASHTPAVGASETPHADAQRYVPGVRYFFAS